MASTTGGALKVYLEAQSLGVPIFVRDLGDNNTQQPPYIVIHEGITATVEATEDGGAAAGGGSPVTEELQVDLYMYARDPSSGTSGGSRLESYALPYTLARVLAGAPLGTFGAPARRIYGCQLVEGPRELPDLDDDNRLRKVYTVALRRDT
jgi:hypothetical protein